MQTGKRTRIDPHSRILERLFSGLVKGNAAAAAPDPKWDAFVADLERNLSVLERPATMLPNMTGMGVAMPPDDPMWSAAPVTCGSAAIAFSRVDGSIRSLTDLATGREWVGNSSGSGGVAGGSLATFAYQSYSDFDLSKTYAREYTTSADFMKPGMGGANPVSATWNATLRQGFFARRAGGGCSFVMQLGMASRGAAAH